MFAHVGLKSEGLYRLSGFSDSVEEVKMGFDKGLSCLFYRFLSTLKMKEITCSRVSAQEAELFRLLQKLAFVSRISVHLWGMKILTSQSHAGLCGQTSGVTNHALP